MSYFGVCSNQHTQLSFCAFFYHTSSFLKIETNEEWSVRNYGSDTQKNIFDSFHYSSVLDRASASHGPLVRHNEKEVGHGLPNTILFLSEHTFGGHIMKISIYCNITDKL